MGEALIRYRLRRVEEGLTADGDTDDVVIAAVAIRVEPEAIVGGVVCLPVAAMGTAGGVYHAGGARGNVGVHRVSQISPSPIASAAATHCSAVSMKVPSLQFPTARRMYPFWHPESVIPRTQVWPTAVQSPSEQR